MTATLFKFRADVQAAIDGAVAASFSFNNPWDGYERAKTAISRSCGWDAPPEMRDHDQYDLAMRSYCAAIGI